MKQTLKGLLHPHKEHHVVQESTMTGAPITTTTTDTRTIRTEELPATTMPATTSFMPGTTTMLPTTTTTMMPKEVIEKAPVLHERIRKEEVEEVQPVIHREHDRLEVHQVVQPMYEGELQPTQVLSRELPAQTIPTMTRGTYIPSPQERSTIELEQAERLKVEKAPIIMDTERRKIIEEVQPVIYKEVVQPTLIRETLPIYEKIVEAPVVTKEVRPAVYCHPVSTSTGFQQTGYQQTGLGQTGYQQTGLGQTGYTGTGLSQTGLGTTGFAEQQTGFTSAQPGWTGQQTGFTQPTGFTGQQTGFTGAQTGFTGQQQPGWVDPLKQQQFAQQQAVDPSRLGQQQVLPPNVQQPNQYRST